MKNETIGDRIKTTRKELNIKNQKSLADLVGVSYVAISQWERCETEPTGANLMSLSKALGVRPEWLLTGDEPKRGDHQIVPDYSDPIPSETYLVDVLDVTASAGYGDVISSEVAQRVASVSFSKEEAATLFRKRPSESVKVITVTGDSMSGTIELGDYIFVDVDKGYFDGDGVYVFIFKGHILVKRIQLVADCYMVVADNPDYAPWEINEENEEHLKIIGRVLYCNSMRALG